MLTVPCLDSDLQGLAVFSAPCDPVTFSRICSRPTHRQQKWRHSGRTSCGRGIVGGKIVHCRKDSTDDNFLRCRGLGHVRISHSDDFQCCWNGLKHCHYCAVSAGLVMRHGDNRNVQSLLPSSMGTDGQQHKSVILPLPG